LNIDIGGDNYPDIGSRSKVASRNTNIMLCYHADMEKFFNTSGPIDPRDHYCLDPLTRVDWPEIEHLIASKRYFVLHAPRQTGKTSALLAMMKVLNQSGRYACAYANIEGAQAARGDETQGIPAACSAIVRSIGLYLNNPQLESWFKQEGRGLAPQDMLSSLLTEWAQASNKPTVLLLDEVDALIGDTLISLLRQIRAGYAQRPEAFPQSIILCGVRDVRDYRMHQGDGEVITGGSAFNIKAKSLRMGNFSEAETRALWQQHTDATRQVFEDAIFPELWLDTMGQPWLVNALGYELTWEDRSNRDRSRAITLEAYRQARERLIYSRATHLDQLADKLREPRVRKVISALLSSEEATASLDINPDDQQYVVDLGLIQVSRNAVPSISNRIYREVIPRELTWIAQGRILDQEQVWYVGNDRRLMFPKLLAAFQQFYRENADAWLDKFDYQEAAPQLLLQAFLQRIVNGGGRINREYALGRKRTDLFIEWPLDEQQAFTGPVQKVVVEIKIMTAKKSLDTLISEGVIQTKDYTAHMGAEEAHLVIFDRRPEQGWDAKIWQRQVDGLDVWGC